MSDKDRKIERHRHKDRLLHQRISESFSNPPLTPRCIKKLVRSANFITENIYLKPESPVEGKRLHVLWFSVIHGYYDSAELIVRSGADVNMPFGRHDDLQFFDEKCTILIALLERNEPFLENGRFIRLIVDYGADLQATSSTGLSVLHLAVFHSQVELTKIFLEKGVDVNVVNCKGETPLFVALRSRKADVLVSLLINHGADVTVRTITGHNILHCLTDVQDNDLATRLARTFFEKGASIDDRLFESQCQPIHHAALSGNNELVKFFLDQGANVNAQARYDVTPLHYASINGHNSAVLQTLLKRGANIDLKVIDGRTALHVACQFLNGNNINLLLSSGADLLIEDISYGQTPFAFTNPRKPKSMENPCIRLMLKALALKRVCLQPSIELKDERIIKAHPKLLNYYQDCHIHIARMNFTRIIRNCTFLELLTKKHCQIVALMQNPDFKANFGFYDLSGFSMYSEDILRVFKRALNHYRSMIEQQDMINEAVHYILPDIVVRQVVRYIFNDCCGNVK